MKRFYAEWEYQDCILFSFPHEDSDWSAYLDEVRDVYCKIIYEVLCCESCILIVKNKDESREYINNYFEIHKLKTDVLDRLYLIEIPSNDTWTRDFGGITICKDDKNIVLDYGFNGWGLKFPANYDNNITSKLSKFGIFNHKIKTKKIILEGGSIESNGDGIVLTNTQCLLEKNRNPSYSKKKLAKILKKDFGLKDIIWLNSGYLAGDDTDSHIDTLARFINKNTIAYISCDNKDDEHYGSLKAMEEELLCIKKDSSYKINLIKLPFTSAKYYNNHRLPATYANFLFINGALLLPIYNDKNDENAISIMQNALPNHKIIPIDCSILIRQHGSLHCISMQFPKNTINFKNLKEFVFDS
ncbi:MULTISPECIES: agmatine deiminase family protein [Helicobacter]|uniref:Agmatine deiminase family protein n=1 Tax=Helicobacter ibis TaxID=2962633 RepID=A0ABT4VDD7_9HELI|nr:MULTISPECIES: agmatine deiminase family protein [Helicobacter]MDA3966952.1 agmatine deiminase family protein [Helicobacter sp. WB40]MDA3968178.1 agmatine deiminase family protein [Helicobacter ibis]